MPANNFLDKYKNNIEATLINAAKMRPGQLQSKKIDTYSKSFLTIPIKEDIHNVNKEPYVAKDNQQKGQDSSNKNDDFAKEIKSKSTNEYIDNNANFDIDEIERLNPSGQAQPQLAVKPAKKFTFNTDNKSLNKISDKKNAITPNNEDLINQQPTKTDFDDKANLEYNLERVDVAPNFNEPNEDLQNPDVIPNEQVVEQDTPPENTQTHNNDSNDLSIFDASPNELEQDKLLENIQIQKTECEDLSISDASPNELEQDTLLENIQIQKTECEDLSISDASPNELEQDKLPENTQIQKTECEDLSISDASPNEDLEQEALQTQEKDELPHPDASSHEQLPSFQEEVQSIYIDQNEKTDIPTTDSNQTALNQNSEINDLDEKNKFQKTHNSLPIVGEKNNLINKQLVKHSFKKLIIAEITTVKSGKVFIEPKQNNNKNLPSKSNEKKEINEKVKQLTDRKSSSMKSYRKIPEVKTKNFFSQQTDRVKKAINNLTTIVKEMIDDEFNQKNKNKKMAKKYIPQWSDEKLENPKFVIQNKTTLYAQIDTDSQKKLNEIIIKQKRLEQFKTLCTWNAGSISLLIEAYLLENFKDKQKVSITPNHLKKIGLSQDDDTNELSEDIDEYSQKEIDDVKDYTFFNPIAARISENKAQRERKEREEKITNYRKALNIYSDEEGSVYQKAIADFLRENKDFLDEVKRDDAYLNELEELEED